MKKLLLLSLLSLGVLGMVSHTSQAGLLRHCFGCCDGNFATYICMRQYNAFTPTCTGSITCNGCCPLSFCGGGCMPPMPNPFMCGMMPPPQMCAPPMVPPYCCATNGCCDADCLPAPGGNYGGAPAPLNPGVAPGGQGYTPPPPTPLPQMSYMGMNPWMMNQVQPVGYYQYNPYYYYGYYGQGYGYNPAANYWQGMPSYPYYGR